MQEAVRSHPELRILGQPDVPVQLHLRRLRRVPRQRLHAPAGLALQRPAVPQRAAHGRDPAADPARRGRGLRHRPRRRRRLRRASTRTSSPEVGRDLRRRGGRHDRRGRRVHQGRHGRHDGRLPAGPRRRRDRRHATSASSSPSTWAPADPRSAWCRSPGTVAWSDHVAGHHPAAPGRRGGPGRRGVVAGDRRRHAGAPWRAASVGPDQVVAVSCTGQWASTVPVDEDGAPGRRLRHVDGQPRRARTRAAPSAGRCRATRPWPCGAGCAARGGAPSTSGADPIGHMLYLEHDEPDVAAAGPLVPGAGRLPVDALHRRGRRLATPR